MARITFAKGEDFALRLSRLQAGSSDIAKKAIYAGVEILADKIKSNLAGVLSDEATGDLMDSFGVTPIHADKDGDWNAKIGFDGYGSKKTKKYPKGIPNQLKARALESGTSFQPKRPFVRPAVTATTAKVQAKMAEVAEKEMQKLTK